VRRLALIAPLLISLAAGAQEELVLPAGGVQGQGILAASGELLRFVPSSGDGANQVQDPCTAFSSELAAPYFCLRGDATQVGSSGMALSAVGSPTAQTMSWCPNGLSCASVTRQLLLSGTNYYQTSSMLPPSGSWWACARGVNDAPMTLGRYLAQGSAWGIRVSATGQLFFDVGGGTNVSSSTGAIIGGASQMPCVWWHQVGAGSNVATLFLDGVQIAQNTTEPNLTATNTQINVGGNAAISRVGWAMLGSGDPSSGLFARMAAATAPVPQGTRGELLTFSRTSAFSCVAPDGTISWLPPGRPCISGGLRVRPAVTNLYLQSEAIASGSAFNAAWTTIGTPTAQADQATAPDGSLTADKVTFSATSDRLRQVFTASATAYTQAISVKSVAASGTLTLQVFDNTGASAIASTNCSVNSTSWTRCMVTTSVATAGHTLWPQFLIASGAPQSFYVTDAQFETGTVASDPCRSEATSATCAAETASVPMPVSSSVNEGCAKACITPNWTGANPLATSIRILSGRASDGAAQFSTLGGSSASVNAFDGTHTPSVAGALTAGAKSCFVTRWSKGANSLSVTNTTTGTAGTASAFSGFSAFDAALAIGTQSGGSQPNAATISDIQLGASAGACQ
jgi:hypothetical protein